MSIVFAARADNANYNARYGNGGLKGMPFLSTGSFSYAADAGAIGGNIWQFPTSGIKSLSFPARKNTPNGRSISFLLRFAPGYTGAPSASIGLMALTSNIGRGPHIELQHLSSSGNLAVLVRNEAFTVPINAVSAGAWSPTAGTYYDIFFSWDGTTTANSFKVYIDGTLLGSITPAAAFSASWTEEFFSSLVFGVSDTFAGSGVSYGKFSESVIWSTVENPTSIGLVGGTGSLNGASRSNFVDVAALDGTSWTALSGSNIVAGASQTQAGLVVNGTAEMPEPEDVRFGVAVNHTTGLAYIPTVEDTKHDVPVDVDGVGEYRGEDLYDPVAANELKIGVTKNQDGQPILGSHDASERYTDVPTIKVEDGYGYRYNSLTNNREGEFGGQVIIQDILTEATLEIEDSDAIVEAE